MVRIFGEEWDDLYTQAVKDGEDPYRVIEQTLIDRGADPNTITMNIGRGEATARKKKEDART